MAGLACLPAARPSTSNTTGNTPGNSVRAHPGLSLSRRGGRPQRCALTSPNSPSSERPPMEPEAFLGSGGHSATQTCRAQPPECGRVRTGATVATACVGSPEKKDCLMQGARKGVPVLTAITPPFYAWQPPAGPQEGASPDPGGLWPSGIHGNGEKSRLV